MEDKTLKEKVDLLFEDKKEKEKELYKEKRFKIPMKGRVSKGRMKKGFVTVVTFKENNNVDFVRKQIIGNTIKLEDGEPISIHALDKESIFFYKAKPIIFQGKGNLNSWNPFGQENET